MMGLYAGTPRENLVMMPGEEVAEKIGSFQVKLFINNTNVMAECAGFSTNLQKQHLFYSFQIDGEDFTWQVSVANGENEPLAAATWHTAPEIEGFFSYNFQITMKTNS